MTDLVSRQAVLDALHTQLKYPTEACAIVRNVPSPVEIEEDENTVCEWCRMPFPSHSFHCQLDDPDTELVE